MFRIGSNLRPGAKGLVTLCGFLLTLTMALHITGNQSYEFLHRIGMVLYDLRLKITARNPTMDDRIVIVDIDEKSLSEVGRWPWNRQVISQLITRLVDSGGASAVGFDVVFAEPDTSDAADVLRQLKLNDPQISKSLERQEKQILRFFDRDTQLAKSIAERPVVLGYFFNNESDHRSGQLSAPVFSTEDIGGRYVEAERWTGYGANLPVLAAPSFGGFFNSKIDSDGIIRSVPLLAQFDGQFYPSLAVQLFRVIADLPDVKPQFPENVDANYGSFESIRLVSPMLEKNIPVQRGMSMLSAFRSTGGPASGGYRYVSATDVLNERIDANVFRNRIVLVGTTAIGLGDQRATPVNPNYPGVEIHANAISSLLDDQYKVSPEYTTGLQLFLLLTTCGLLAVLLPRLTAGRQLAVGLLALGSLSALDSYLYFHEDLYVPFEALYLGTLGLTLLNAFVGYLVEAYKRKAVVSLFGEYVAPELVELMANDPANYSMEGEERVLTVMFSDVRGFTGISEQLSPDELKEYINTYLTRMSEIIRRNRGTLDKYIGDAIMAFWGAPVDDPDHAQRAVQAGLEMSQAVDELNQSLIARGWPAMKIGIGISTGRMRVGDMGSNIRRAYTVMGDAVNLGSRLEGITKHYDVTCLVSEQTRKQSEAHLFRFVDTVKVKGKDEAVRIYEPLQCDDASKEELKRWELAQSLYHEGELDMALFHLNGLCQTTPHAAYDSLREKISEALVQGLHSADERITVFDTK